LWDVGRHLGWAEFRSFVEHLPPDPSSALWRARFPRSWWWTPEVGFQAAILHATQSGNWQRGGGRGQRPKPIQKPVDAPVTVRTHAELVGKKREFDDEIARRRAARDARRKVG